MAKKNRGRRAIKKLIEQPLETEEVKQAEEAEGVKVAKKGKGRRAAKEVVEKTPEVEEVKVEEVAVEEPKTVRAIMVKPLPQILDEIEDSVRMADDAAKDARAAAEEARLAGEKAANEAARVAAEAISRVEEIAMNGLQLAELLQSAILDGIEAIENRIKGTP